MPDSLAFRLRGAVNAMLHPLGLHVTRRSRAFEMTNLLEMARHRGFEPATIVDIGASDGVWTLRAHRIFPRARFVLFEPLRERQEALERLRRRHGFHVVAAAAGAVSGRTAFFVDPDLDGSSVAAPGTAGDREVPVEPLDAVVDRLALPGPYCLKLDTHGYEVPVLEGARQTLPKTELLIIEAYNFDVAPGSLRFPALCSKLEALGFRCLGLADPLRRPSDGALWQMDLAFAPASSAAFANNSYR